MKLLLRLATCLVVTAVVAAQSGGIHVPLSRLLRRFRQQPLQTTAAPAIRAFIRNSPLQRRWQQLRSQMRSQATPSRHRPNIARIHITPRTNSVLDEIRARRARQRQEAQAILWAQRERQRQLEAQRAQREQLAAQRARQQELEALRAQQELETRKAQELAALQEKQRIEALQAQQELEARKAQQELAALQEKQRIEALQAQQEHEAQRTKQQQLEAQKAQQKLEAQKAKQQLEAQKAQQQLEAQKANQLIVPEKANHLHQQNPDMHKTVADVNNVNPGIDNKRLERLMNKERRLTAKKERISKMRNNRARRRKLDRVESKLQTVAAEIAALMNAGTLDQHSGLGPAHLPGAHGGHTDHASGGVDTHHDHLGAPAVLKDVDLSKGIPEHVMAEANRPLPGHDHGHGPVPANHANTHSAPINPNNIGFRINDMPIIDLASAVDPSEQIRRLNIMRGNTATAPVDHSHAHAGPGSRGPNLGTGPTHVDHGGHQPSSASDHPPQDAVQPWAERHVDVHGASDVRHGGREPTASGGIRLTSGELMPMPLRQPRSASSSRVSTGSRLTGFLGNVPGQIRRNP